MRPLFTVLIVLTALFAASVCPVEPGNEALTQIQKTGQRIKAPGYERELFGGGWAPVPGTSCDTREMMILSLIPQKSQDSSNSRSKKCAVPNESSALIDPYSGVMLSTDPAKGEAIEIDHLFPLSAAWDMGAHSWDKKKRRTFANDPLNLIVASKTANREKSDKLPAEWLPSKRTSRCWYSKRLAEVTLKYELVLPQADISLMKRQCLPLIAR